MKDAAASLFRPPNLTTHACACIGDPYGPRFGRPLRSEGESIIRSRSADECDFVRICRPHRAVVLIHAGIEVLHGLCGGIEDSYKAVIATVAHKTQPQSIGRPAQRLPRSAP